MKAIFTSRKFFVLLGFSLSLLGLGSEVSARSPVSPGNRVPTVPNLAATVINGNITPAGNLSNPIFQSPCSSIKVVLRGRSGSNSSQLSSARAKGSNILSGCTYTLKAQSYLAGMSSPNFTIEAVSDVANSQFVYGQSTFPQPIPTQVDVSVENRSTIR